MQAQLSEHVRLYRDETAALLQDRELARAERIAEQARHEQLFEALTARLQKAQSHVCDLTSALVQSKKDLHGNEESWTSERNRLVRNLDLCKVRYSSWYLVDLVTLHKSSDHFWTFIFLSGTIRGGLYARWHSAPWNRYAIREKLRRVICPKRPAFGKRQDAGNVPRSVFGHGTRSVQVHSCFLMWAWISISLSCWWTIFFWISGAWRLRDQAESSKNQFKSRVQKMAAQVTYLRNKYNELDRRRMLEAEG